ncbi:cyclic-phosphate processing receiver domain-containing protein [Novipirellula sp. SH528]|uniref:cyclic-phosphate processing receiver domain-containing protein n=1 Tax=Novipirellula sp. SH528 TaxID=3454466 RepID=UPI003FA18053
MRYLVMLEDDLDRIRRFNAIIAIHHPSVRLEVYRTAPTFIAAYSALTSTPCLICLDHDLFVDSPDDPDPGDGRDVSTFLTTQDANCPALIHSTNAPAADSMMFSMRDAGWTVDRIAPIGDDWIESYWYPTAVEMIMLGNSPKTGNGG